MGCSASKSTPVVAPQAQEDSHYLWMQNWHTAPETEFVSGHDGSPLTKEDILKHNRSHENVDWSFWHPWKGQVYDLLGLYRHFKPSIETVPDIDGYFWCDLMEENNQLILQILPYQVDKAEIYQALKLYHVGPLVQLSDEEKKSKLIADLEFVRLSFSPQVEEYPPGLEPEEHEVLINEVIRNMCNKELWKLDQNLHHNCRDLNEVNFSLPLGIDSDDLREWLRQWEQFDTEVPEGGAWRMSEYQENLKDERNQHELFAAYVRHWMEKWECFDLSIEGEAGWHVIEQDLVKNDETTEEQEAILESRLCRTDLEDEGRMERRRKALAAYFIQKYEWDREKIEPFLEWAQLLKENAAKLKSLSTGSL